jgi:2-keto-4-pentenoate hydratase/2-oxohepta-3-ene-1,7-dioic acid hydratase in catechol pathway
VKFASFIADGRRTFGVVRDDSLIEASEAIRARYADLRAVLAGDALADLEADSDGQAFDASSVEYLPTIPNPDKVICVGVNYRPHLEEMGRSPPDHPVMFVRFAGSQVGHKQPIVKSRATEQYDFEGELGVVIGRPARYVSRDAAMDYIAGYTCFMDGTARDWQRHTTQFTPGKNFHRSGAMGPYLVSRDEIPDVTNLELQTRVNGAVMQEGRVSELIFDIPYLIEYLSTFTELLPGDVISTGTPAGVGAARTPPIWLADGDEVAVDIGGIGVLVNPVCGE